ncbi:MAG: hypothetical protein HFE88_03105 [Acutalibacter sp.]|nr:hypothetical protein [Acutalibacter sp.]
MNQYGNRPLEEEYRASQMYRKLTGAGADKLAEGLGRAAAGIDGAINGFAAGMKGGARHPYGNPGAQPRPAPPPTNKVPPGYRQQHVYKQPPQQTPPPTNKVPPGYRQQAYQKPKGQTWQTAPRQAPQPARRPGGVTPAPAPKMPPMKVVRRGSPAKFYITGAAAVLYSQMFPMYNMFHFGIFALVLVLVFLGSAALFKGKKEFVPIEPEPVKPKEPEKPQEEAKPSRTGNPEVDKIIDEGNGYLRKLRAANDAIPDEALSEDIDRMERASADIFAYIADHPGKAPQIRKFMNYYLPTTLKLLGSYERLSRQSVKGENITSTMFNIAGMMHTVADAFEKQLDSLFTDEAMDISADITVFESMLEQEGFVEDKTKPSL